jgi:serine/threonine protein kinase
MHYEIIAKGSYGVVITPSVNNVTETIFENNKVYIPHKYIGKLFNKDNKEDFEKELFIMKRIISIIDYEKFTVPIINASRISIKELKDEPDILKSLDKTVELYQIVYQYGGTSITSKLQILNISFSVFIHMISNFYSGIRKLHNANIIHRDIKPVNVLYDDENKKLNLIDYGLSCDVDNVYRDNKDDIYILGYMYMYNPPEFYVAYLLYENMKKGKSFEESIDLSFKIMTNYSKELEIFYYEHYYKYNQYEPYNIYSYRQAFQQMLDHIKLQNINTFDELFTKDITFKSDVYSSSFILKSLKKHIIFENVMQRQIFNELHNMTYDLNPFTRKNIDEILEFINENSFF